MRLKSQKLILVIVAFLFSLQSTNLFAASKKAAANPELKVLNEHLDQFALSEAIRHVMFDYSMSVTPQRFAEGMMRKWPQEDQKFFAKWTQGMAVLPMIASDGNSLTFKSPNGLETKLEFVPGDTKSFRVNGSMWSYNPNAPLGPQLEALVRNHPPKKTSSLFLKLFVPEAQAFEPVTMGLLTAAVITGVIVGSTTDIIKQFGTHLICKTTLGNKGEAWYSFQPRNMGFCKDWDTDYKNNQRSKAPKLDAIEQMIASDKSNVLTKFKVEQTMSCPSNNDGKDRLYDAVWTVAKSGRKVRMKINFTPQGKVKDYNVFDVNSGDQLASVEFDTENYMKCAKTKNPKATAKSDALTPDEVSLCRDNTALTTEERGKLELLEDAAKFVNMTITKCTTEVVTQKVVEGKVDQVGSPAAPKEADKAVPPPKSISRGAAGTQ